jgi:hypothetical protein
VYTHQWCYYLIVYSKGFLKVGGLGLQVSHLLPGGAGLLLEALQLLLGYLLQVKIKVTWLITSSRSRSRSRSHG